MKGGGRSGGGGVRKQRIEHALREALTEAIAADVKDPRVQEIALLAITRVELNVDLSVANCYVSIPAGEPGADAALQGLRKAAGFLRGPIGRRLGLQRAPELRFQLDPSLDMSEKLAQIVREDEEKARAAGRETPAPATAPKPPPPEDKP